MFVDSMRSVAYLCLAVLFTVCCEQDEIIKLQTEDDAEMGRPRLRSDDVDWDLCEDRKEDVLISVCTILLLSKHCFAFLMCCVDEYGRTYSFMSVSYNGHGCW